MTGDNSRTRRSRYARYADSPILFIHQKINFFRDTDLSASRAGMSQRSHDGHHPGPLHFYVTHATSDQPWAEWIADQLERKGFTVELGTRDWLAGESYLGRMSSALQRAQCIIAIYTDDFFTGADLHRAPHNSALYRGRKVVPVQVQPCQVPDIVADVVPVDLVGVDEAEAADRLAAGIGASPSGLARGIFYPGPSTSPGHSEPRSDVGLPAPPITQEQAAAERLEPEAAFGTAKSLLFSPDGRWLVTVEEFGAVRVWSVDTGSLIGSLVSGAGRVSTVFGHDSSMLTVVSSDGVGRQLSIGPQQSVTIGAEYRWRPGSDALRLVADHSGAAVVATSRFGAWRWHPNAEAPELLLPGTDLQVPFDVSQDSRLYAVATDACDEVHVRSLGGSPEPLWSVDHRPAVTRVQLSPAGRWLGTADETGAVRVWDTGSGLLRFGPAAAEFGFSFSPDERRVALGLAGKISIVDLLADETWTWEEHEGMLRPHRLTYSPGGEYLAVSCAARSDVYILEARRPGSSSVRLRHRGWVNSVAFSPDEHVLLVASRTHRVQAWLVESGPTARAVSSCNQKKDIG
ncbi:toll/interleukin-1 receptor domain-containing protein [Frankia sp. Cpl3]|nr:toll/interleukin-1 receptor domain-containing protein [Frankia sp. Cpl3]